MDDLADHSEVQAEDPVPLGGKTYALTKTQLNYLISSILRNISSSNQNRNNVIGGSGGGSVIDTPVEDAYATVNASMNATSLTEETTLSDDEKITMIFYVLVFFIWYGGLIFICLIGFGVYQKPSSYEMYRKFVDRKEIREKLKREKLEEHQRKKLTRQSSYGSSMSGNSFDQSKASINGGLSVSNPSYSFYVNRSPRSVPSTFILSSTVYSEEEEGLLVAKSPGSPKLDGGKNGQVMFDI